LTDGVFEVFEKGDVAMEKSLFPQGSVMDYYSDLKAVMRVVEGPAKSLAFGRLSLLEKKFEAHLLLNEVAEIVAVKMQVIGVVCLCFHIC
jgi:AMP deaminase